MDSLTGIESFVRSAEARSFSAAARRLGLTPAAVSKNVAKLETSLGVRLFQRSTRRLALTEAGERFLADVSDGLATIQSAVASASSSQGQPAGTLKVSMSPAFGRDHVLPYLGDFLARYPAITPDWHFDYRQVDLIGEGFDAAIGGGIDLVPGVVARELTRIHVIPVASPTYLAGKKLPSSPKEMTSFHGIVMRSALTGRLRTWPLQNAAGEQALVELAPRLILSEPEGICRAAVLGFGVAFVPMLHALPHLENSELVRLLPDWWSDAGPLSLYFANQKKLLPAKTRVFIDFLVDAFRRDKFAARFSAIL